MFFITNKVLNIFLLLLGVIDCLVWSTMIVSHEIVDIFPIVFISIRGLLSITLYLFIRSKKRHEDAMFMGVFAAILFYLFSIIGLLGIYLIFNINLKSSSKKALLYHIDKEEGEEVQDSKNYEKPVLIKLDELREVAPLADGLTDDDTVVRIAAISAIEETDSTKLFKVLIESKKDAAKEVQYYAHEALKKISDKYMKKINNLTKIINKSGPDYKTFKELADLYAVLAHKDIEHPILVRFYRQEAMKYYSDLLKNYQEHRKTIIASLISVLYENADYRLCINYCKELYKEPGLSSKSLEYTARCLFKLRDIKSLKELAQEQINTYPGLVEKYIELTGYDQRDG